MPNSDSEYAGLDTRTASEYQDRSLSNGVRSPDLSALCWIAVIGTIVVLLWQVAMLVKIQPRQGYSFVVLFLASLAVGAVLIVLLPKATLRIKKHLDLLLPLGLLIPLLALLDAVIVIPGLGKLFTVGWPLQIMSISFYLSLSFFIRVFLQVTYAGWTMHLIMQSIQIERVDPFASLGNIGKWFLRVLVLEFIGWAVLFSMLAVAIALAPVSILLALFLIGIFSLIWNFATAALLPIGIDHSKSLFDAVRDGITTSLKMWRRWWLPVVAQMVLMGWVTLIYVSYSNSRLGSMSVNSKTNWSVNGFWTGGFDNDCRWHSKLMQAVETPPLPIVSSLLGILFAVLAIDMKIRIVDELQKLTFVCPEIIDYPKLETHRIAVHEADH